MAKGQKSRAKKTSQGLHGGGGKGAALTIQQKILLGGGILRNIGPKEAAALAANREKRAERRPAGKHKKRAA